jgi:hypothetical protein
MCFACEGGAGAQRGIPPELLARARAMERMQPGEAVPDDAWCILAGSVGGAIAWADYRRMAECLEKAAAMQFAPAITTRPVRSCVAVDPVETGARSRGLRRGSPPLPIGHPRRPGSINEEQSDTSGPIG